MKYALVILLVLHGAIHLLGFVKGAGLAEVPQLHRAISTGAGILWLAVAVGFVVTAVLLLVGSRHWWIAGLPAVLGSQALIVASWSDAKFGTIPNLVVAVPLAIVLLDFRGSSLRSQYDREVRRGLAQVVAPTLVTDAELAGLPPLLQTYLRRVGVVGKPHVRNFRATFRGQMRQGKTEAWMDMTAEQVNFYAPPGRLFFMQATRAGIPFDAFHRYVGPHATFEVRIAGLYPMVDARGPAMDQSETVTMLNDMCLLAPATLVDQPVTWETVDDHTLRATFTNAGQTVHADLTFDARGDLVGFVSHDRYQTDGTTTHAYPWSTPLTAYGEVGGYRLWKTGEARWVEPDGEWAYGKFELVELAYNVGAR